MALEVADDDASKRFLTPMPAPVSMVLEHLLWKMDERSSGRLLVTDDAEYNRRSSEAMMVMRAKA